ncbi:MAG: Tyrosine-protein phosphatase YopH [Chlamydiae bacterium]|nr:Tyrosine-protein phosphatase YopH [Chlamydiota bacterium]
MSFNKIKGPPAGGARPPENLGEKIDKGDWEVFDASLEDLKHVDTNELTPVGSGFLSEVLFTKLEEQTKVRLGDQETLEDGTEVISRFSDISCPRETAVEVFVEGCPKYLHANFVDLRPTDFPAETQSLLGDKAITSHIATQAPKDGTYESFWKAALENTNVIVDLTNTGDRSKGVREYFPCNVAGGTPEVGERKFGDITVTCVQRKELKNNVTVFQYHVNDNTTGEGREITRIHYLGWPDRGVADIEHLEYLRAVEEHISGKYHEPRPSFVHCRAGVGRTGAYITSSALREMAKNRVLTADNQFEVINSLILQGREARGKVFVQTHQQLHMIRAFSQNIIDKGAKTFTIDYKPLPGGRAREAVEWATAVSSRRAFPGHQGRPTLGGHRLKAGSRGGEVEQTGDVARARLGPKGVDEKTLSLANQFVQRFGGGQPSKRVWDIKIKYLGVRGSRYYGVERGKKGSDDYFLSTKDDYVLPENIRDAGKKVKLTPKEVESFAEMEELEQAEERVVAQAEEAKRKVAAKRVAAREAARPKPKHTMKEIKGWGVTDHLAVPLDRAERFKKGLEDKFKAEYPGGARLKALPKIEIRESSRKPGTFRVWLNPKDLARLQVVKYCPEGDYSTESVEFKGNDMVVTMQSAYLDLATLEGKLLTKTYKVDSGEYDDFVRQVLNTMNKWYIDF